MSVHSASQKSFAEPFQGNFIACQAWARDTVAHFIMLVHSVYFYLKPELTDAQRAEFRRGVETLKSIRCVEAVYVGAPASVPDRPVVDKSFSVALTVVCADVAAHDAYQVDPIHKAFAETFKPYWSRIAIFDSEG